MISKSEKVEKMVSASFLNDSTKREYLQAYYYRLKKVSN